MESAIAKSLRLLDALSRSRGPVRLSTLATELGLQKSTVHRILGELVDNGYARQEPTSGLYAATLRTWELGTAVVADLPIKQVATPALHDLHRRTGETVSLTVRDGDDVLYLDKIVSPRPMRFTTRVGSRVAAPLTASGQALLSLADDADEVVTRVAERPTLRDVLDIDRLRRQIADARRRGYAASSARPGVRSVAAPIVDRDGAAVAALSVSAPTARTSGDGRAEIVEAVLVTANQLGESLGRL